MLPASWITPRDDGCMLTVKVVPRASKTEIAGPGGPWLRIRLQAPPVDGRANAALVAFLAGRLDVAKSAVSVVAGDCGRVKQVCIDRLDADTVCRRLGL